MQAPEATDIGGLLERLSRETDIGVALLDAGARFLYVNDAMAALHGLAPDDIAGRALADVPSLIISGAVARAAQEGAPFHAAARTADGRAWDVRYVPMDDGSGRTIGVIARDITEREAAAAALERLALQRRQLVKASLEAAERERGRVADDLHDDVLQRLLFVHQEWASIPGARTNPAITRAIAAIEDVTERLRAVVDDLHPVTLASTSVHSAVHALAQDHAARGSFSVRVQMPDDLRSAHDLFILSALRELLGNVAQHAPGAEVGVLVAPVGGDLVIEVADDGPGFDPATIDDHVGLAGLFARVEGSGGRAELESSADGTRVRLALPLD